LLADGVTFCRDLTHSTIENQGLVKQSTQLWLIPAGHQLTNGVWLTA
jgi:hypothetical protein